MRIQRHHISKNSDTYHLVDTLCQMTNEFKNECYRIINKHYNIYNSYDVGLAPIGTYPDKAKTGSIFLMSNMFQIMKETSYMFRGFMSSKVFKSIIKVIETEYRSYFKALKSYSKNKNLFKGKPQPPKCNSERSRYMVTFEKECIATTLNSDYISIGGNSFIIDIPNINNLIDIEYEEIDKHGEIKKKKISEIKEVIILPSRNGYLIHVVYEKFDNSITPKIQSNNYMGIDIGVVCLLAFTSNHLDLTPTMISGAKLKNLITDYSHKMNILKSKLKINKSKRLDNMWNNFNNKKLDYCHKISRYTVNEAVKHNISKIVIGNNKFWKQNTRLGKNVTKIFQSIPYDTIISMIKYKAEEIGIEVITREESYTSKLSFLDLESFSNKTSVFGKREKRSIYNSSNYGFIHADINASLNILRKEMGNNIFDKNIKKYKINPKYVDIALN